MAASDITSMAWDSRQSARSPTQDGDEFVDAVQEIRRPDKTTVMEFTGTTEGSSQIAENPMGAKKRKFVEGDKTQKTSLENRLEWIVRSAVERAVERAIKPLQEEITQLQRSFRERPQEKRQEEKNQSEKGKGKRKAFEQDETKEKETRTEKGGEPQSYSQAVQKGLPNKEDEWKMAAHKKTKKRFPIEHRRLLFKLESGQHTKKQTQDLLHLANQVLRRKQAEGVSLIRLDYTPTDQISAVLNEQASREMVTPFLPALQQAFQETGVPVHSIGAVETWNKLKVHLVPISRYFRPDGLVLAREEIEAILGHELPTAVRWLKKAEAIEENQRKGINHTSIVVTVPNEDIAKNLMARGLYFGGKKHPVEEFFNSSREVCPDCCQIGHKKDCTNPHKCFLCAGNHHWKDHQCTECSAKRPCQHTPLKCANCNGKHEAVNPSCLVARGKRENKQQEKAPTPRLTTRQARPERTPREATQTTPEAPETGRAERSEAPGINAAASEGLPSSPPLAVTPEGLTSSPPPTTTPEGLPSSPSLTGAPTGKRPEETHTPRKMKGLKPLRRTPRNGTTLAAPATPRAVRTERRGTPICISSEGSTSSSPLPTPPSPTPVGMEVDLPQMSMPTQMEVDSSPIRV